MSEIPGLHDEGASTLPDGYAQMLLLHQYGRPADFSAHYGKHRTGISKTKRRKRQHLFRASIVQLFQIQPRVDSITGRKSTGLRSVDACSLSRLRNSAIRAAGIVRPAAWRCPPNFVNNSGMVSIASRR